MILTAVIAMLLLTVNTVFVKLVTVGILGVGNNCRS